MDCGKPTAMLAAVGFSRGSPTGSNSRAPSGRSLTMLDATEAAAAMLQAAHSANHIVSAIYIVEAAICAALLILVATK